MRRLAPEWYDILLQCQVNPTTAAIWSEVFAACVREDTFSAGDEDAADARLRDKLNNGRKNASNVGEVGIDTDNLGDRD